MKMKRPIGYADMHEHMRSIERTALVIVFGYQRAPVQLGDTRNSFDDLMRIVQQSVVSAMADPDTIRVDRDVNG